MEENASPNNLSPTPVEQQRGAREFTLLEFAIVLAKRRRLVVGVPVVVALITILVVLLLPNTYTGVSRILPPQQNQSALAGLLGQLGGMGGATISAFGLKNPNEVYVGMLKSTTIADKLIGRFSLKQLYQTETLIETRKELSARTEITAGRDGIIAVEVEDKEPQRAADLANAYVQELDELSETLAVTEASQRRLFFEKQLKLAKEALADAEVALKRTQESTGLIQLDMQGRAMIESIARVQAEISAKEVQLGALGTFATPDNPDYQRLREQLAGLRAQLRRLEQPSTGNGRILVPSAKLPESGMEYVRRFRDVKYQEVVFELMAKQFEMAKIDEARDAWVVQVLDKALPPDRKSKPKRAVIVIVTTFLAASICLALAAIFEWAERARMDPQKAARLAELKRLLRWKSS